MIKVLIESDNLAERNVNPLIESMKNTLEKTICFIGESMPDNASENVKNEYRKTDPLINRNGIEGWKYRSGYKKYI
ncbi:MAG: hypothetical protein ACRDDF_12170 [Aeromonas sp.]